MIALACLVSAAFIAAAALFAMISAHKDQEYFRWVLTDVSSRMSQVEKALHEDWQRVAAMRRAMMNHQLRQPPRPGAPLPGLPGSNP